MGHPFSLTPCTAYVRTMSVALLFSSSSSSSWCSALYANKLFLGSLPLSVAKEGGREAETSDGSGISSGPRKKRGKETP